MVTQAIVQDFLAQKKLAVVGVSRKKSKFGNQVYRDLKRKGYQVFPLNRNADHIDGDACYPSLSVLPAAVDGIVLIVPPEETESIVREAVQMGIRRIWMQQGAESPAAIRFCEDNHINVVYGHCIMMFSEPVSWFHKFHRWIWGWLGKLPK